MKLALMRSHNYNEILKVENVKDLKLMVSLFHGKYGMWSKNNKKAKTTLVGGFSHMSSPCCLSTFSHEAVYYS